MSGLSFQDVSKRFGAATVVDRFSLDVAEGEFVALVGPSGCGKTTSLRMLAGLEEASAGRLMVGARDVTDLPARDRNLAMVFQSYALYPHLTAAENIGFALSLQGLNKATIQDRVQRAADRLGIGHLLGRRPKELSGGQRQRVALARALAVQPRVLLLDEPFGALDAKVRKDLRRWLRTFQEEIKITTVFVTHDQEEALELADEVVVMNNARIEQVGTPQQVYDKPTSPFVIEFLGNVNRFRAGLATPADESKGVLYVRPHDVEIEELGASEHEYALKARVLHVFSAGNYGRVALERVGTHEQFEAEVSRERLRQLHLQPGSLVSVVFRHVRLFDQGRYTEGEVRSGELIRSAAPN
jgi:sulfate transport system ATP-binding protein